MIISGVWATRKTNKWLPYYKNLLHIHVYSCICICVGAFLHVCTCVCMYVWLWIYVCAKVCEWGHIYAWMYVMCACVMYVFIYLCVCSCAYVQAFPICVSFKSPGALQTHTKEFSLYVSVAFLCTMFCIPCVKPSAYSAVVLRSGDFGW